MLQPGQMKKFKRPTPSGGVGGGPRKKFAVPTRAVDAENPPAAKPKTHMVKKSRPLGTSAGLSISNTPRSPMGLSAGASSSSSCARSPPAAMLDPASLARKNKNAAALFNNGPMEVTRASFIKGAPLLNGNIGMKTGIKKKFQPPGKPGTYNRSTKKIGGGTLLKSGFLTSKFIGGQSFKLTGAIKLKSSDNNMNASTSDGSDSDSSSGDSSSDEEEEPEFLPHEPLVVWEPNEEEAAAGKIAIEVPTVLAQFLRPHQREGVQFGFECTMGLRDFDGSGCILADDMGLGKTLQSIAMLYTLLMGGKEGRPTVKRAIVVCPCSLVNNWAQEFEKWINSRVKEDKDKVKALAMSETDKKSVTFNIAQFLHPSRPYHVLIISYETFRMHIKKFTKKNDMCCDFLICDEAHRLKNADSLTSKALSSLACRRRVLLSGTPVQNDLGEFFAMVDFTNPAVLGTAEDFRRYYQNPILTGREPDASPQEKDLALVRQNEMSLLVNQFILRRMNTINAQHLPDKLVQVVCCKLTPLQTNLYKRLIAQMEKIAAQSNQTKDVLSYLQMIQKLCNHPTILTMSDTMSKERTGMTKEELSLLGVPVYAGSNGANVTDIMPAISGKMDVLHRLMRAMRQEKDPKNRERIVVISIFTQTLDLVEKMCAKEKWPVMRLDGKIAVKKRQAMVNEFNNMNNPNAFCFLLSSKAGGCGINLIGANRLVLFDSDWNPATDKQVGWVLNTCSTTPITIHESPPSTIASVAALSTSFTALPTSITLKAAARCWRDGQKRKCYTYRFLSAGTMEEKVYQRQLSKEGLASVVEDKDQVNELGSQDLKRLFVLRENTPSDTHDKLKCKHCQLVADDSATRPLDAEVVELLQELVTWLTSFEHCKHILEDAETRAAIEAAEMAEVAANAGAEGGSAVVGAFAGKGKKAEKKKDPSTLDAVSRKLAKGEYRKLTQFGKDVRNVIAKRINDFTDKAATAESAVAVANSAVAAAEAGGASAMQVDGAAGAASSSDATAPLSLADANAAAITAIANAATVAAESKTVVEGCEMLLGTFESRWVEIAEHVSAIGTTTKQFTAEELAAASASLSAASCGGAAREASRRPKFNLGKSGPKGPMKMLKPGETTKKKDAAPVKEVLESIPENAVATQDYKPQLEMPKEEDLNNWSHHFSTDTVADPYLRKATQGTDLVSFVFGLDVSWDLTQKQNQIDLDRELERAEGKKLLLEEAKQREEARKGKKGRKRKVSDDAAEVAVETDGDAAGASAGDENDNGDANGGFCDGSGSAAANGTGEDSEGGDMSQEEGEPQGAHFEGEGDDAGGDKHHMQIDGPSEDGPVDPAAADPTSVAMSAAKVKKTKGKAKTKVMEAAVGADAEGLTGGAEDQMEVEGVLDKVSPTPAKVKAKAGKKEKALKTPKPKKAEKAQNKTEKKATALKVCPFCTFENGPKKKKCGMCMAKLPDAPAAPVAKSATKSPRSTRSSPRAGAEASPAAATDADDAVDLTDSPDSSSAPTELPKAKKAKPAAPALDSLAGLGDGMQVDKDGDGDSDSDFE